MKDKPTHGISGRGAVTWCGAGSERVRWTRLAAAVTCKKCLRIREAAK